MITDSNTRVIIVVTYQFPPTATVYTTEPEVVMQELTEDSLAWPDRFFSVSLWGGRHPKEKRKKAVWPRETIRMI